MAYQYIDVSSNQGEIDWSKVKADGVQGVILRAGWSWFEGGMDVDPRFIEYVQGAAAAGLDTGVYLFSYDLTPQAARIGAQKLVALLQPYRFTLPIAFDMESNQPRIQRLGRELTKTEAVNICLSALEVIEESGYYAILYSNEAWWNTLLNDSRLERFDRWVAHVGVNQLDYDKPYGMWQYSWDGRIDGIAVPVDLDYAYKNYPAVIRAAGLNHLDNGNSDSQQPDSPEQTPPEGTEETPPEEGEGESPTEPEPPEQKPEDGPFPLLYRLYQELKKLFEKIASLLKE